MSRTDKSAQIDVPFRKMVNLTWTTF